VSTGAVVAAAPPDSSSPDGGGVAAGGIEIVLRGSRHLRISDRNFDELMLRRLVQALESIGDEDRKRQRC